LEAGIVDQAIEFIRAFFRNTKRDQGKQYVGRDVPEISASQSHGPQIRAVKVIETLLLEFSRKRKKICHGAALFENEERSRYNGVKCHVSRRTRGLGYTNTIGNRTSTAKVPKNWPVRRKIKTFDSPRLDSQRLSKLDSALWL
jgi:hypothetical protein